MGKEKRTQPAYDYESGGLSFTQRVQKHAVGDSLRSGRKETDDFNGQLL